MTNQTENNDQCVPHPPLTNYYPAEAQRRRFVSDLFDETAQNYDWIIKAMSLGSGNYYRYKALQRAGLKEGMNVLDVATGTGPVAAAILKIIGQDGSLIGLDRSINMLKETHKNVGIPLVQSDAGALPFPDNSFYFLSMGYALRHVDSLEATFKEYLRVLKPGGKLLLLELTSPKPRISFMFTRLYMYYVVPFIARIGTGNKDSKVLMEYYWDTIEKCVRPQKILDIIASVGFEDAHHYTSIAVFSEYTATSPGVC